MSDHQQRRVVEVIQGLNYEFSEFTLPHFIAYLVKLRQRPIILQAIPLEEEIHGIWLQVPHADYVLYNWNDHPLHQVHNVLHEIGHILLDHRCYPIPEILPPELLAKLNGISIVQMRGQFRLVEQVRPDDEREAEMFVRELQRKIMFADRLDELARPTSSISAIERYTRNLGYHG
jgi:hypothetical protein